MSRFFKYTAAAFAAASLMVAPMSAKALDFADSYVNAVYGTGFASEDFAPISPGIPFSNIGNAYAAAPMLASEADAWDNTFATELKLHGTQEFGDAADAGFSVSFADMTGASVGGSMIDVQQAYVSLNFGDWDFTMGRFYAPIGIESVDANARPTISLSNVFAGLEPFFLTGAILQLAPEEGIGGFLFVTNSFDVPVQSDLADAPGLGVGVTYTGGGLSATLQYNVEWFDDGADTFSDAAQLVDLSVLYESDTLFGGLDVIFRNDNDSANVLGPGNNITTVGVLAIIGMNVSDALQAGLRGEGVFFGDDGDGQIYGITVFGTYDVTEGVFIRGEARIDIVGEDLTATGDSGTGFTGMISANATFE